MFLRDPASKFLTSILILSEVDVPKKTPILALGVPLSHIPFHSFSSLALLWAFLPPTQNVTVMCCKMWCNVYTILHPPGCQIEGPFENWHDVEKVSGSQRPGNIFFVKSDWFFSQLSAKVMELINLLADGSLKGILRHYAVFGIWLRSLLSQPSSRWVKEARHKRLSYPIIPFTSSTEAA